MPDPLLWGPVHVSRVVDMREGASLRSSLAMRNRAVEIRTEECGCANVPLRGARVHGVHREPDGRFALAALGHSEGGTIGFCIVPANGNVWWVFEFDLEDQYNNWISVIREEGVIMLDFLKRIELTEKIGCGAQSRVFEAIDRATATVVAVKVATGEADMQSLFREVDFLHALRGDEGVIMHHGLYEFRVEGTLSLGLVLERFDGTLDEVLRQDAPCSEEEIRPIVLQLVRGVAAVHHKGMVHRDIKPGNILVRRGPGRVAGAVLADFGLGTWTNDAKKMGVRCGTMGFCAPEVLQCKVHVSAKSQDMFSVGIIILLLLTGKHPFGSDPEKWPGKNERGKVDMPASISRPCLSLLEGLCAIDPAERWTAMDALDCQWLCEPSLTEDEPIQKSLADPDELGTQLQRAVAPTTPSGPGLRSWRSQPRPRADSPRARRHDVDSCPPRPDSPSSRDAASADAQRSRPTKLPPIPVQPPRRDGPAWRNRSPRSPRPENRWQEPRDAHSRHRVQSWSNRGDRDRSGRDGHPEDRWEEPRDSHRRHLMSSSFRGERA